MYLPGFAPQRDFYCGRQLNWGSCSYRALSIPNTFTQNVVDEIIFWLTGYDKKGLQKQLDKKNNFETFFKQAPQINPDAALTKSVICGYRVEDIEHRLIRNIRYLDKLIDELARGKKWTRY